MSLPKSRLMARRTQFYDAAAELTPFVATEVGTATYLLRTNDKHLSKSLFSKGGRGEIETLARVVALLEAIGGQDAVRGRTFLEVGANIGTTTVPALLDHGFGLAVALEPAAETFQTLRLNAVVNGLESRLLALPVAASNEIGRATLAGTVARGGKHAIAVNESSKRRATLDHVEIETVTLDSLVKAGTIEPEGVGLLWIDAQAHEGHVLEGAELLLESGVPTLMEWDPGALARQDGLEKVARACEFYTHFLDLRGPASGLRFREASALPGYTDHLEGGGRFTDVLLLRLEPGEPTAEVVGTLRAQH